MLKWTVTSFGEGKFHFLICADFEDAMDHALDTPIEYSKPVVRKVNLPSYDNLV